MKKNTVQRFRRNRIYHCTSYDFQKNLVISCRDIVRWLANSSTGNALIPECIIAEQYLNFSFFTFIFSFCLFCKAKKSRGQRWRLSTFPHRCQRSIIDVSELNFCVRNGNRCIFTAITTIFDPCQK